MALSFPKTGDPDAVVGQTPWSARFPLDPLLASEIRFIQTQQADVGVGCGPGGPPHQECRLSSFGKTKWHWALPPANPTTLTQLPATRCRQSASSGSPASRTLSAWACFQTRPSP